MSFGKCCLQVVLLPTGVEILNEISRLIPTLPNSAVMTQHGAIDQHTHVFS